MNIEELQKVIGTPEENRDVLVKSLLLDLKLKCTQCNTEYVTEEMMEEMTIMHYADATNPRQMTCQFVCRCGHSGGYTFKPNPFIPVFQPKITSAFKCAGGKQMERPYTECWCVTCDVWQDTLEVDFVDVQENAYGEDSFTFVCPLCDKTQTSLVRGR